MEFSNDTKRANEYEGESVTTSTGDQLLLEELLGEGAEGCVYRAENGTNAVKIFWRSDRSPELARKLQAMIPNQPVDPTADAQGSRSIVWPTALVKSTVDDGLLGHRMPYLDLDRYQNTLTYAYDELRWDDSTLAARLKAAVNMATAVAVVHKQGHALGDQNHQNLLVDDGVVTFIDCDSYHVSASGTEYGGSKVHGRYAPPGGRGSSLDDVKRADRFGLAIHLFQLLMEGYHPFVARGSRATEGEIKRQIRDNRFAYANPEPGELAPPPDAPDYDDLPVEIRRLFEDCFGGAKTDPSQCPTAETWIETIKGVFSDGATGGESSSEAQPRDRGRSNTQGESTRGRVRQQRRTRRTATNSSSGSTHTSSTTTVTTQRRAQGRSSSQSAPGTAGEGSQPQGSTDESDEMDDLFEVIFDIAKYPVVLMVAFVALNVMLPGDLALFLSAVLTIVVALRE